MSTYAPRLARVGAKYTGWIDAAIAAKEIRKDIKSAQKDGQISVDVQVIVKTRKYAGGQAIDVVLTGWNSEAVWGPEEEGQPNLTRAARRVVSKIDVIRRSCDGETTWGVKPWTE